ncbi:MAG: hypothetical protein A2Y17_07230 [Clostridiales bacterium GWF2_38_85]|nr:MAG: hypothetical protein A2Y17_07230 [Clostridiales bacterium GWF2_38_85]HBL85005.1 hypothetical protein [Clostridiales bacterium]
MTSFELVSKTIKGEPTPKTPLYGWVSFNMSDKICAKFGCVENFEDHYEFDLAHIFGGPAYHNTAAISQLHEQHIEITPEVYLNIPLPPVDNMDGYSSIINTLDFYKKSRKRFCYLQTNGIFECLNEVFGIENHLMYLLLYPEELKMVYQRQAEWNRKFALNAIELGVDMIHVSDDWGGQNNLLFSKELWHDMIYPYHKITCDAVRNSGAFLSLHSDGHILPLIDDIIKLEYQLIHPWQESAAMPYKEYLTKYSEKIAIMGGINIQSTLGFGKYEFLKAEIERVFATLKGKRWICCTSHFVQEHCSIDELIYAYDLAYKLAKQ